jgi:hypothetical protein
MSFTAPFETIQLVSTWFEEINRVCGFIRIFPKWEFAEGNLWGSIRTQLNLGTFASLFTPKTGWFSLPVNETGFSRPNSHGFHDTLHFYSLDIYKIGFFTKINNKSLFCDVCWWLRHTEHWSCLTSAHFRHTFLCRKIKFKFELPMANRIFLEGPVGNLGKVLTTLQCKITCLKCTHFNCNGEIKFE